jgi:hypothetical protein
MNHPELDDPGFADTVSFEARAKLYKRARLAEFFGKIAATAPLAICRCFYDHEPFILFPVRDGVCSR